MKTMLAINLMPKVQNPLFFQTSQELTICHGIQAITTSQAITLNLLKLKQFFFLALKIKETILKVIVKKSLCFSLFLPSSSRMRMCWTCCDYSFNYLHENVIVPFSDSHYSFSSLSFNRKSFYCVHSNYNCCG